MSLTVEKLYQDLEALNQRKNHALEAFHQIVGAVSIVEQMIQRLLNPEAETPTEPVVPAAPVESLEPVEPTQPVENVEHGQAIDEAAQQTA